MSDVLTKEFINALTRRHKRKARRTKRLKAAIPKPPATGGTGVADGPTKLIAT